MTPCCAPSRRGRACPVWRCRGLPSGTCRLCCRKPWLQPVSCFRRSTCARTGSPDRPYRWDKSYWPSRDSSCRRRSKRSRRDAQSCRRPISTRCHTRASRSARPRSGLPPSRCARDRPRCRRCPASRRAARGRSAWLWLSGQGVSLRCRR